MEDRFVTIFGFPATLNLLKLKLFVEKHVSSGCVEKVAKKQDGSVTFTFNTAEGLQKFHQSNIKEIKFGDVTYPLRITNTDGAREGRGSGPRQLTENLHSGGETTNRLHESPGLKNPVQRKNILEIVTQKDLYKNMYYWSSLPVLPASEGSMGVLVQNIDTSATHIQKVSMHFESKKRSSGGPVECIVKMVDGLLIIFKDPKDCDACLEATNQIFGEDIELKIYPKPIPAYFKKKFVLKNVGGTTAQDTLEMFLESCSAKETAARSCVKMNLPGVYLVEYDDDYDVSETEKLLHNIKLRKLEGNSLKATPLLKTDCLEVFDIPADATNDSIRLVFESKKRTDGGQVTRIDRLVNQCALVYFALFSDVERVYERFKSPSDEHIIINQHPVKIELYHHSLANDHEKVLEDFQPIPKKQPDAIPVPGAELRPFELKPQCEESVFNFITSSQKHGEKLRNFFKYMAEIGFQQRQQNEEMAIRFTPAKKLDKETQNGFNSKCQKNFEDFLAEYTTVAQTFDKTKLQNARSHKMYPQIDQTYSRNADNADLVVAWKTNEPVVEVTGMKAAVDLMIEHITNSVNCSVAKMPVNNNQFRILVSCGIVKELREKYKDIQIKCDEKNHAITITGPDGIISTVQIDALTMLSTIEKKRLVGLDESIVRYLSESMTQSNEITSKLQEKLRVADVKAAIGLDGDDPCLRVRSNNDLKQGIEVIKQFIVIETIRTDESKSNVVKSPAWKGFQQTIKGNFGLYVKPNQSIVMVGLMSQLKLLRVEINKFLDEHAIKTLFINMTYGSARFVVERSTEFSPESCEKREIKCGLSPEGGGGVFAEGKARALDVAFTELSKFRENIVEVKHTLEDPGIKEYYQGEDGRQFLDTTGRVNSCIILTMTRECVEWIEFNKSSKFKPFVRSQKTTSVDFEEQELASVTLANTSVSLKVWKTDIIKHKCDVIVNASNAELKLLPSGVSGVISKHDRQNGEVIQKEMDKIIESNYGNILPGDAVITSAGNLPACKKIVHAVGPRWNSISDRTDPKQILKASISKSLGCVEKAGLKSIAIPAISCGVFGGEVGVCVPLILEAVDDYFKEMQNSCVKKVHFVENSRQEVLDAFVKCVTKHKSENASTKVQPQQTLSTSQASSGFTPTPQNSSCNISLVMGDIVSQQADVIVNTTDPRRVTNMAGGGVISKILAQRAGSRVLQECASLPPPHNLGNVFATSGGRLSCQSLYHAVVTHYDTNSNTSQAIMQSVVSNCLQMADATGYQSIVFPAIATGGYKYPPQLVAKWMRQEILNFSGNSLKNVIILLYPKNRPVIDAFNAEFNATFSGSSQSSSSPSTSTEESKHKTGFAIKKIDSRSTQFGPLKVSVVQGDITQQLSDVIVNSTNDQFDLSQGMVSTQIIKKGGKSIQDEASLQSGGDYVVTSGGKLPCKKIIHLVTPNNPKDLQKKIMKVLKEVENQRLASVCLPALGTGNLHMDYGTVGSIMRASIEVFVQSNMNLTYLDTVNVVIFDKKMLKDFKETILSESAKKGIWSKLIDWGKDFFSWGGDGEEGMMKYEDNSFDLFFYSTNREDINEAIRCITTETRKMTHRQVITDDAIGRLTKWEKYEITEIGKQNKVKITDISDKYIKRLTMEGLTKDVMTGHEAIKDVLREFVAAESHSAYVIWQRKTRADDWEDFPPRAAHKLESAFIKARNGNNKDPALKDVQVPEFNQGKVTVHAVDLSTLDNDPNGKDPPKIRRKIKEKSAASDIPASWDDMKGQQQVTVSIVAGSTEYQNVLTKFQRYGVFHRTILSIERVQNISLYKQYIAKKAEVEGKLKNLGRPIELELFHGTNDDDKILLHGFDRSYAGKNATAHGRGVYFAVRANYSHGYAAPNSQGYRRMFLADVMVGDYCQGSPTYLAPPPRPKSQIKNDLYDSVVDNLASPQIYVIFKDASAYPTYLITYA